MLARLSEFVGRVADSRTSSLLGAAGVMIAFGAFDYFADATMLQFDIPAELHAAAQATFVGIGAGVAALGFLLARGERRKRVREELLRIGELNHRLRNSLELIADAHHDSVDAQHKRMMMEAIDSMNRALKDLFPVSA